MDGRVAYIVKQIAAVMVLMLATNLASKAQVRSQTTRLYTPTESERLRRAVNVQNWDDGGELTHFAYLHVSQIFLTEDIHRKGSVSVLEKAPDPNVGAYLVETKDGRKVTLAEYISGDNGIDGFIVLHHGRVVYEAYPRMRSEDKHLLMSVTKAFVGTAVGILEDRGKIDIRRPINDYIQALKGTAWEGIAVRDILEMASGMEGANESYTDPTNKHYQYEASLGWQPTTPEMPETVRERETYRYVASLKRLRNPGETWAYTSINTAILGWLLEEVTGQSVAQVLTDEIWAPMGAEADAQMAVNCKGVAVSHGGMAARLRDVARFGLLFTPSWNKTAHTQIISERFLRRILTNGRTDLVTTWVFGPRPDWLDHVAYQWDAVTKSGMFFKGGFGGQILYVAPQKDVVIAHFGTNKTVDDTGPILRLGSMIEELF
jgi:CubicO group peptidase (beta-lactamase class C family)